jgi:ribulose kinase
VLAWFSRLIDPQGAGSPGVEYAMLDTEAAEVPAGSEGVRALDHFQGNRTPHTDPASRGAIVGLTLKHGR